jgi:hypothetical protein
MALGGKRKMSLISDALSVAALNQSTVERQQELNGLKLDSRKCRHVKRNLERSGTIAILFAFASASAQI